MRIDVRSCDDWSALYIDGVLKLENHSLYWAHVVEAIQEALLKSGTTFSIEVTREDVPLPDNFSDETHYVEFTEKLQDIKVSEYKSG